MNRRKYIAALGSVAAGSAFAIGSSASIDIWADRETSIEVVNDDNGLISLSPFEEDETVTGPGGNVYDTNGRFASTSGGTLGIDLSSASDAKGVNVGARTTIDNIFKIKNQSGTGQVVWIKDTTDDGTNLLGDEGPLHFFRGPVELSAGKRVVSVIDPVPRTPTDAARQRLTITGLVPAQVLLSNNPPSGGRRNWINAGHPVTDGDVVPRGDLLDRESRVGGLDIVDLKGDLKIGDGRGRLFLKPGEEMRVGIDADFSNFEFTGSGKLRRTTDGFVETYDETSPLPDTIQVVSRSLRDARQLASGDTEFNVIPGE